MQLIYNLRYDWNTTQGFILQWHYNLASNTHNRFVPQRKINYEIAIILSLILLFNIMA